jgi:ATP/maltotriose-dependent transcriptional regulator MalT
MSSACASILGPAGYGKSTVLAERRGALVAGNVAVAWLRLDRDDNDPNQFMAYLPTRVARSIGWKHATCSSVASTPPSLSTRSCGRFLDLTKMARTSCQVQRALFVRLLRWTGLLTALVLK